MCYWSEGASLCTVVGGVAMLLFWASVVGLAVWAISRRIGHPQKQNGALAIARERYARGEIGKEEFDRIKKDLS